MTKIIYIKTLEDLPQAAIAMIEFGKQQKIWLFEGEMGAGKTTTIKAICQALGVESIVQSPTFSIVNEYQTNGGQTIYHFDCYRLKNINEALDIGIDEYFDSGNLCLIEWPSMIQALIPDHALTIKITAIDQSQRSIELSY